MDRPKIRSLDAFPVEHEGKPVICIRDPQGLAPGVAFVPHPVYFIMTLMNGERTILEIQEAYVRQFGHLIFSQQIQTIVQQLDENLFLESARFRDHRKGLEEEFRKAPLRRPSHAGAAYPEEPDELRKVLGECLAASRTSEAEEPARKDQPLRGLVAPHIDFARGTRAYGVAYGALAAAPDADLYVVLGVGHSSEGALYTLTTKDFETPLGVMKTDAELVQRLAGVCGDDLFQEEFTHRSEHSIEFQIVFLQHLFDGWESKRIVPILCGSFHELILAEQNPWENPEIERFTNSLRSLLEESGTRWTIIAGVDLAHVGAHFGDAEALNDGFLARLRRQDEEMLEFFEKGDAYGFFESIQHDADRRRVCGALAMYTLLEILQPEAADLLHYQQCVDQASQTCVTVAAAAVY
jgi:AmmeMemoRadiSam system protein B